MALQLGSNRDFESAFIAACTGGVVALLVAVIFSGAGSLRLAPKRHALIPRESADEPHPESTEPPRPMGGTVLFWTFLIVSAQLAAAVFVLSS